MGTAGKGLLEYETLTGDQIKRVMRGEDQKRTMAKMTPRKAVVHLR